MKKKERNSAAVIIKYRIQNDPVVHATSEPQVLALSQSMSHLPLSEVIHEEGLPRLFEKKSPKDLIWRLVEYI